MYGCADSFVLRMLLEKITVSLYIIYVDYTRPNFVLHYFFTSLTLHSVYSENKEITFFSKSKSVFF